MCIFSLFSIFNHTDSKIVVVTGEARLQGQQKKNVDDQKSVRKKKKRPLVAPIFNHADCPLF